MVVGTSQKDEYDTFLNEKVRQYPTQLAYRPYSEEMGSLVYAGADIFLMPSLFEPSGLGQLVSLRYGTIPIVYRTGGLSDTIQPCAVGGNGFVFEQYNRDSFIWAIQQALHVFQDRKMFEPLAAKAFTYDFSWDKSAEKYVGVYEHLVGR